MIVEIKNLTDKIIKFEEGEMEYDEVVSFFQELVNTGLVWNLQGFYGRTAVELIQSGAVVVPDADCEGEVE